MSENGTVQLFYSLFSIFLIDCIHFTKQKWVAAQRTLAEYNQAAGKDVGAFNCNAYGDRLVDPAEEIARPQTDGRPALDVHGVIYYFA